MKFYVLLSFALLAGSAFASENHPDLQGIWTNVTLTPLVRAPEFAGRSTLTPAEAKAWEKKEASQTIDDDANGKLLAAGGVGGHGRL